jgi:hypothetical protein
VQQEQRGEPSDEPDNERLARIERKVDEILQILKQ